MAIRIVLKMPCRVSTQTVPICSGTLYRDRGRYSASKHIIFSCRRASDARRWPRCTVPASHRVSSRSSAGCGSIPKISQRGPPKLLLGRAARPKLLLRWHGWLWAFAKVPNPRSKKCSALITMTMVLMGRSHACVIGDSGETLFRVLRLTYVASDLGWNHIR